MHILAAPPSRILRSNALTQGSEGRLRQASWCWSCSVRRSGTDAASLPGMSLQSAVQQTDKGGHTSANVLRKTRNCKHGLPSLAPDTQPRRRQPCRSGHACALAACRRHSIVHVHPIQTRVSRLIGSQASRLASARGRTAAGGSHAGGGAKSKERIGRGKRLAERQANSPRLPPPPPAAWCCCCRQQYFTVL